jgi:hypothetical protein
MTGNIETPKGPHARAEDPKGDLKKDLEAIKGFHSNFERVAGDDERIKAFRETLSKSSIKDMRCRRDLLSEHLGELEGIEAQEAEMQARTAACCDFDPETGYYTIGYTKINDECEYGIGLGDFVPPSCVELEVIDNDGEKVQCVRGERKEDGRPCFFKKGTTDYYATFSGCQWRPTKVVEPNKESVEAQNAALVAYSAYLDRQQERVKHLNAGVSEMQEFKDAEPLPEDSEMAAIGEQAQEDTSKWPKKSVNNHDKVLERRGKPVLECIKWTAQALNMPMAIIMAHLYRESRFTTGRRVQGDKEYTTPSYGSCQLRNGTIAFIRNMGLYNRTMDRVFEDGYRPEPGENIFADIIAIGCFFRHHARKAGFEMRYNEIPSMANLVYLRCAAKGDRARDQIRQAVADGKTNTIDSVYVSWLEDVHRFNRGIPPEFSGLEVKVS